MLLCPRFLFFERRKRVDRGFATLKRGFEDISSGKSVDITDLKNDTNFDSFLRKVPLKMMPRGLDQETIIEAGN